MKIKCLIADDEALARMLTEEYIRQIPQLQIAAQCKNAIEALAALQADPEIELLFLDIHMPQLSGMEMLRSLKNKPVVIFITAHPDHAVESYELDVADYLLKPVSFSRFLQAVNKATDYISLRRKTASSQKRNYLLVRADHKLHRINFEDILYIESLREYVSIYTREKRIITLQVMKSLEETLPADRFVRVHRSFIVAIDKIEAIDGQTIEIGQHAIPIGKSYRDDFLKLLNG